MARALTFRNLMLQTPGMPRWPVIGLANTLSYHEEPQRQLYIASQALPGDHIVCMTPAVHAVLSEAMRGAGELLKVPPSIRFAVIPLGIEIVGRPSEDQRDRVRHELGLKPDSLLYLTRVSPI